MVAAIDVLRSRVHASRHPPAGARCSGPGRRPRVRAQLMSRVTYHPAPGATSTHPPIRRRHPECRLWRTTDATKLRSSGGNVELNPCCWPDQIWLSGRWASVAASLSRSRLRAQRANHSAIPTCRKFDPSALRTRHAGPRVKHPRTGGACPRRRPVGRASTTSLAARGQIVDAGMRLCARPESQSFRKQI
jgi:hypothetical protein